MNGPAIPTEGARSDADAARNSGIGCPPDDQQDYEPTPETSSENGDDQ